MQAVCSGHPPLPPSRTEVEPSRFNNIFEWTLNSAGRLNMYMYVGLSFFKCSHTIQSTALKLWNIITDVTI